MKNWSWIAISCVVVLLSFGCQSDTSKAPDVSDVDVALEWIRFDKEVESAAHLGKTSMDSLELRYPDFYRLYFTRLLPISSYDNDSLATAMESFFQDDRIKAIQHKIDSVYNDDASLRDELKTAMKYYKHYFPNRSTPRIYTFMSEFAYQSFIFPDGDKDGIGVGLDMFLGSSFPYKGLDPKNPAFSDYLTRAFNREHISKKVTEVVASDILGEPKGDKMIDHMIQQGKKLYLMDLMMPNTPDSILIEYSSEEWEWVKENELEAYSFFLDHELFYVSNLTKIFKYTRPSPTSYGMPPEAPGRVANYIGWQIVKAYMQRHPETSVEELINTPAQKIMDGSKYKPRRKK